MKNEDLIELPKNDRYRSFLLLLYPDSRSYNIEDIFFELNGFKNYAYILHQPESDEKKPHYHVYIKLDSACTISAVSKRLGIPINHIQHVRSERASLRYLSHIDYEDKIQYNFYDIKYSKGIERSLLKSYSDVESESDIINSIYKFIDSLKCSYSYSQGIIELIRFVNMNFYDSIYKRYRIEFSEYMKLVYFG